MVICCISCFPLCPFFITFLSMISTKTTVIMQPLSPPFFEKKRAAFQKNSFFQFFLFAFVFFYNFRIFVDFRCLFGAPFANNSSIFSLFPPFREYFFAVFTIFSGIRDRILVAFAWNVTPISERIFLTNFIGWAGGVAPWRQEFKRFGS